MPWRSSATGIVMQRFLLIKVMSPLVLEFKAMQGISLKVYHGRMELEVLKVHEWGSTS